MKLGMAICLCLGMCSPLVGQETLLASGSRESFAFIAPPAATVVSIKPIPTATFKDTAAISGLPADSSFDAAVFEGSPAVCTEAMNVSLHSYAFDHLKFSAAAIKATFAHANMVKMARNFVPGQPLPDAPFYVPLTPRQKFEAVLRNSYSASLGVGILSDAVISQATGAYPRLERGMTGFGQRLGVSAVGNEAAAFFGGFVYPTLFHQDPRYFPSHEEGIGDRLAYAASRALIGRSDDGRNVINTSVIASQFTEAALAKAYIPYRNQSMRGTVQNALTGMIGVAEGNILNEFWPDIEHFVFSHTHNTLVRHALELAGPTQRQGYR